MIYSIVYIKPLSEEDIFNCELHSWNIEADCSVNALQLLEANPSTPYRIYLCAVIPYNFLGDWLKDFAQDIPLYQHEYRELTLSETLGL